MEGFAINVITIILCMVCCIALTSFKRQYGMWFFLSCSDAQDERVRNSESARPFLGKGTHMRYTTNRVHCETHMPTVISGLYSHH